MMSDYRHNAWWIFLAGVAGLILLARLPLRAAAPSIETPLDAGYRAMYDLRFDEARQAFDEWQRLHAGDPMGPASEAASYLFSEFNRLGVLRGELFVNDKEFKERQKPTPDPLVAKAFDNALAKSQKLAQASLERDPQDTNALLAEVLGLGLRSDYVALVEGRDLAALRYMKNAGVLANRLLKIDPSLYDAYLAVGAENYLLSLNPAPVRWALRFYGVETSKAEGVRELRLTAERGHYFRPFARLLLAIAALRDHNRMQAAALLEGLTREFPDNQLYARELARLQ